MRGEELLDVLEHIDPVLIEQADRKPKGAWLRWTALAACLALVIGICALFLPGEAPSPDPTLSSTLIPAPTPTQQNLLDLIDHTVSSEKLTGVQVLGDPSSGNSGTSIGPQGCPPAFSFRYNLMVEARMVELLPDIYTDALTKGKYYILRMKTLDAIVGQNFPQEFYLRLPTWFSTELDRFDSLIFSLSQTGIDHYLMINQTTQTMETFTLLFDVDSCPYSSYDTAIAFWDGALDPSLWDMAGWSFGSYDKNRILEGDRYLDFPAKAGSSPEEVKANILDDIKNNERLQNLKVETQADFPENQVFDYVEPFENGVFAHTYDSARRVVYTRLINGFRTNEEIVVQGKTVIRSGETFTTEDLSALPDIGGLIEGLDLEHMQNPHAQYYEGKDVRLWRKGATGMYAKVDGQVYGIVKVTWCFLQNGVYDVAVDYFDALYYLVDADGSYRTATYEEVYKLLDGDDFLVKPTTLEELNRYSW